MYLSMKQYLHPKQIENGESKSIKKDEDDDSFSDSFMEDDYLDSVEKDLRKNTKRDAKGHTRQYRRAIFDLIIGILDTWQSSIRSDLKRSRERRRSGRALLF